MNPIYISGKGMCGGKAPLLLQTGLGNTYENWMLEEFKKNNDTKNINNPGFKFNKVKPLGYLRYKIGRLIFLYFIRKFNDIYFRTKGMKEKY